MAARTFRRLVIDTNIVRAAGQYEREEWLDATLSDICHDFLSKVETEDHEVVITPAIEAEWLKHMSRFSSRWLVQMQRRKKRFYIELTENEKLRERIKKTASSKNKAEALLKDCHLVEAALATDKIIISLDNKAADLFASSCNEVKELRSIAWLSLMQPAISLDYWFGTGAKAQRQLLLKNRVNPAEKEQDGK